jgi:hypothetical protein
MNFRALRRQVQKRRQTTATLLSSLGAPQIRMRAMVATDAAITLSDALIV